MKKIIVCLFFAFLLFSCEAIKKSICPDCDSETDSIVYHHVYDTISVSFNDTVAFVAIEYRDTIPIFKGTNIFFGSSYDSISVQDSMRYLGFEIMNYGETDYIVDSNKYLNLITDVEVNSIILHSDTLKIESILSGYSKNYLVKYPVRWFVSEVKDTWIKADLDLPYHYRLSIVDQDFKVINAYYPIPLNDKLPVKQYDEVTGDTIIYWQKPTLVINDTIINTTRIGYAYKDSLLFIDSIVGCDIYSHYFDGNKFYSFTVDTCLNLLCAETMADDSTESISALVIKAWSDIPTATAEILVNDSIVSMVSYSVSDSQFVCLMEKSFAEIRSVEIRSEQSWTVTKAFINNFQLFENNEVTTESNSSAPEGYYLTPVVQNKSLIAKWTFENGFEDVSGNGHTGTLVGDAAINTTNVKEGTSSLALNGTTTSYGDLGVIDVGNKFTVSGWIYISAMTDMQVIMSNADGGSNTSGFKFMINYPGTTDKKIIFETSTGTANKSAATVVNTFVLAAWNHIVVTVDSTNGLARIYLNSVDVTNDSTIGTGWATNKGIRLGLMTNNADPLLGNLDDIRIYNKLLTTDEIKEVFKGNELPVSITKGFIKFLIK